MLRWQRGIHGSMMVNEFLVWLVVWNIFVFSIYWEESSQLTFIFFRGVGLKPPTSCKFLKSSAPS